MENLESKERQLGGCILTSLLSRQSILMKIYLRNTGVFE